MLQKQKSCERDLSENQKGEDQTYALKMLAETMTRTGTVVTIQAISVNLKRTPANQLTTSAQKPTQINGVLIYSPSYVVDCVQNSEKLGESDFAGGQQKQKPNKKKSFFKELCASYYRAMFDNEAILWVFYQFLEQLDLHSVKEIL